MTRFGPNKNTFFNHGPYFEHRATYGTANSTTKKKGTDNKLNNSSEYNHDYYEGNKEKWSDNKTSSSKKKKNANKSDDDDLFYDKDGKARFGHKDYDPNDPDFKRTDGEKIEGTELRTFTNANGSTIILGKGIKFSFPPGTKITKEMAKRIAQAEGGSKDDKEQYVARMLNAVTSFADKQKLSLNGKKKSSKKKASSEPAQQQSEEKKDPNKLRGIMEAFNDTKKKKK